ncbi:MAG TPA: CdaR family protein [Candidatus Limnocylindria bacterium]|jgi:YbbR domain-containing protein
MAWLFRNWALKLGAVALATILYTGLVFSGSFSDKTLPDVPVTALAQPEGTYLLTQQLGRVDIRYRSATDAPVTVTAESFAVTIDLASYDMTQAAQVQSLKIHVRSLTDGVEILSYTPNAVSVALDRIDEMQVPVAVDSGQVPAGLEIGTPQLSLAQVTASGPRSRLDRVDRALATVRIDPSGIDCCGPVDLVPVDINGARVDSVELNPSTVRVQIDVSTVETSRTVPIRPLLIGAPAAGFEVGTVTADPAVVTLRGSPEVLAAIAEVLTEPISLAGTNSTLRATGKLVLPDGARLADPAASEPTITVQIRETVATRTLLLGLVCTGVPAGSACLPQLDQVAAIVTGTVSDLDALDPSALTATLDASGLGPGDHLIRPTVALPTGVRLVSMSPISVTVTIVPPATPAP